MSHGQFPQKTAWTNALRPEPSSSPCVLLPMKHVMVIDCNLRRKLQAACLAEDEVLANLPMGTGLALAD